MAPRDRRPERPIPTPPPSGPALVRPTLSALLISLSGVGGCNRVVGEPPMADPGDSSKYEAVGDEGKKDGEANADEGAGEAGGPEDSDRTDLGGSQTPTPPNDDDGEEVLSDPPMARPPMDEPPMARPPMARPPMPRPPMPEPQEAPDVASGPPARSGG